jgi:hypothetical protein
MVYRLQLFQHAIQKYTKFANFARLYIFLATKLCNFTHFCMLFLAACGDLFASPCLVLKLVYNGSSIRNANDVFMKFIGSPTTCHYKGLFT